MPIYEFECRSCGERFEALVAAGTDAQTCPECRAEGARRAFSPVAPAWRLNMSPGQRRVIEEKRRGAPERAMQRFIEKRRKRREAAARRKGNGGSD